MYLNQTTIERTFIDLSRKELLEETSNKCNLMEDELKNREQKAANLQAKLHSKEEELDSMVTQLAYDVEHYKNMYEDLKRTKRDAEK